MTGCYPENPEHGIPGADCAEGPGLYWCLPGRLVSVHQPDSSSSRADPTTSWPGRRRASGSLRRHLCPLTFSCRRRALSNTLHQDPDELFDVVDADDRVIGQATRAAVHRDGLLHRSAHVFVFNSRGELFLQRRALSKDENPGVWDSSAAGHLDAGESYAEAARRELLEELGLALGPDAGPGAGGTAGAVAGAEGSAGRGAGARAGGSAEAEGAGAGGPAGAGGATGALVEVDGPLVEVGALPATPETGYEFRHLFVVTMDQSPRPDPAEVMEGRFFRLEELDRQLADGSLDVTPAFRELYALYRAWAGRGDGHLMPGADERGGTAG